MNTFDEITINEFISMAGALNDKFGIKRRENGESFVIFNDDDRPELMTFIRESHGDDIMPDDFRYQAISSFVEAFASMDGSHDIYDEIMQVADNLVDFMKGDLIRWLSSHGQRSEYVDQALADMECSAINQPLITALMRGQFNEWEQIGHQTMQALESLSESYQVANYAVGKNESGYLPDHEPECYANTNDALQAVQDLIEDDYFWSDSMSQDEVVNACLAFKSGDMRTRVIDNVEFWVHDCEQEIVER